MPRASWRLVLRSGGEVAGKRQDPQQQAADDPGGRRHVQRAATQASSLHPEVTGVDPNPDGGAEHQCKHDETHAETPVLRKMVRSTFGSHVFGLMAYWACPGDSTLTTVPLHKANSQSRLSGNAAVVREGWEGARWRSGESRS